MAVQRTDTVVVGAGQAGLSISHQLTEHGRDHVVLERNDRVASAWRRRWDSFTLVTPNWTVRLPDHPYDGDDPDGFMGRDAVVAHLEDYAASFDPPVRYDTEVVAVDPLDEAGHRVTTSDGQLDAANVVVAAGTFQQPRIPAASRDLPDGVQQLHSNDHSNPDDLADGAVLVVGAGQSGSQIARELHDAGRDVHLSVGRGTRLPRRYRGRDAVWWLDRMGVLDGTVDELDDPAERFAANPRASGRDGGQTLNLHDFARDGIRLLGRMAGVQDGVVVLADDLHANLASADEADAEFRAGVDEFVHEHGIDAPSEDPAVPGDGYDVVPVGELDLADAGIRTVLWATGYRWDYGWVHLPVFDEFGYPVQDRGVTAHPGLYFLGLHFLHTRKSGLLLGVGDDARHVAAHIEAASHQPGVDPHSSTMAS